MSNKGGVDGESRRVDRCGQFRHRETHGETHDRKVITIDLVWSGCVAKRLRFTMAFFVVFCGFRDDFHGETHYRKVFYDFLWYSR